MKRAMAHSLSMTSDRQRSMRMSMTRLASTVVMLSTSHIERSVEHDEQRARVVVSGDRVHQRGRRPLRDQSLRRVLRRGARASLQQAGERLLLRRLQSGRIPLRSDASIR